MQTHCTVSEGQGPPSASPLCPVGIAGLQGPASGKESWGGVHRGRGKGVPRSCPHTTAGGSRGTGRVSARSVWVHPTECKPPEKPGNVYLSWEAESSRRFGVTTVAQELTGESGHTQCQRSLRGRPGPVIATCLLAPASQRPLEQPCASGLPAHWPPVGDRSAHTSRILSTKVHLTKAGRGAGGSGHRWTSRAAGGCLGHPAPPEHLNICLQTITYLMERLWGRQNCVPEDVGGTARGRWSEMKMKRPQDWHVISGTAGL